MGCLRRMLHLHLAKNRFCDFVRVAGVSISLCFSLLHVASSAYLELLCVHLLWSAVAYLLYVQLFSGIALSLFKKWGAAKQLPHHFCFTKRNDKNRIYTPYLTVDMVISLPKIPYSYTVHIGFWPTLLLSVFLFCSYMYSTLGPHICFSFLASVLVQKWVLLFQGQSQPVPVSQFN